MLSCRQFLHKGERRCGSQGNASGLWKEGRVRAIVTNPLRGPPLVVVAPRRVVGLRVPAPACLTGSLLRVAIERSQPVQQILGLGSPRATPTPGEASFAPVFRRAPLPHPLPRAVREIQLVARRGPAMMRPPARRRRRGSRLATHPLLSAAACTATGFPLAGRQREPEGCEGAEHLAAMLLGPPRTDTPHSQQLRLIVRQHPQELDKGPVVADDTWVVKSKLLGPAPLPLPERHERLDFKGLKPRRQICPLIQGRRRSGRRG